MAKVKMLLFCTVVCTIIAANEALDFFGGNIVEDTKLDVSNSPYFVNTSIIIDSNITLEIDPGVELIFEPGTGVLVKGSLVANGSETQRITFTARENSSSAGVPYSWHGITWMDGAMSVTERRGFISTTRSSSVLVYVDVKEAGAQFVKTDSDSMVRFSGTRPALIANNIAPFMDNVHVIDNFGPGVSWRRISTIAEVYNAEILNNNGNGFAFSSNGFGRLLMESCIVKGNDGDGILSDFVRPDDTSNIPHHRFCSFSMEINQNIVLDFDIQGYLDCVKVNMYICSSETN